MSDKPAEQAYHARGAGREERKFEEVLELHVNSSESMRETYRRTANSDMENFQEGFTEGVRRAIEVYGNWRIAREPGADTGTTPPLLTKQQREELVRAAHTLGDFTLETDHRAQELILLVESYMATAAERGTTPPELWNMWVRNLETGQIFPATARDVGQGVSKGWILEREVSERGTMPHDEGLRDHKQLANFFWRHAPVLWADRWTCRCGRWALSRELNSVEQADESRSQHIADAFLEWTAAFAATQRAPVEQGRETKED